MCVEFSPVRKLTVIQAEIPEQKIRVESTPQTNTHTNFDLFFRLTGADFFSFLLNIICVEVHDVNVLQRCHNCYDTRCVTVSKSVWVQQRYVFRENPVSLEISTKLAASRYNLQNVGKHLG